MAGNDLYQAIGGAAACRKLSLAFYTRVDRDPLLRPLFPGKSLTCAIEEFAAFLAQFLGGPAENTQRRWWLSLRESHLRFKIGRKERDAWMKNMMATLDEAQIEEPVRSALRDFFERSSAYVINRGPASAVAKARNDSPMHREISGRWDAQRRLDEAVAAVRSGDADRAIALAETCDRNILTGLLALMIGSGHSALLDYAQEKLTQVPALIQERYAGRTLLHVSAGAGNLSIVELLLRLGADPNAPDGGGHTPLYSVGNECRISDGGKVVHALVRAGAKVDASDGVKHCTALHMAARRGSVDVAKALLECGADIEARDTLGETPLRRSVNCDKPEVAALLLSRGADRHSKGSKGLTPLLAARSGAMKKLLR
jgi:truncated hemoglobin YjbI